MLCGLPIYFGVRDPETANSQNADIESLPDLLFCYFPLKINQKGEKNVCNKHRFPDFTAPKRKQEYNLN